MLSIVLGLVIIAVFAFAYRARGGAIPLGNDTEARLLFWALPITIITTIIALLIGAPWWLGLVSGTIGFGLETLGHSFAQNRDPNAEAEMGLVTFTRLAGILLPFAFFSHVIPFFALLGILSWAGSRWSYSAAFDNTTLQFFNILWCRPTPIGGSEWEELFDGAVFGLAFASILALVM